MFHRDDKGDIVLTGPLGYLLAIATAAALAGVPWLAWWIVQQ